ncbi:hypothetical protein ACLKA6_016690 [Drosophila palustris]
MRPGLHPGPGPEPGLNCLNNKHGLGIRTETDYSTLLLLLLLVLVATAQAASKLTSRSNNSSSSNNNTTTAAQQATPVWDHAIDLNEDFRILWQIINQDITFEIQARTLGYVGFGFSPDGNLAGADMAIGWVDKGQTYFQDMRVAPNVGGKRRVGGQLCR